MGFKSFLGNVKHTLKLARKSSKREFFLFLKLVFLGLLLVGTIGFIIQFVGSLLKLSG